MTASAAAGTRGSAADLTVVCCIEFGRLEEQTVLMVRSLRAFGGAFAGVPVIAVIGRFGAPLRRGTRAELERLGVRIVRARQSDNPATWLNYANKIAAVRLADRVAETSQIAWFDSDMFVLQEPGGIQLADNEDIAAQCHHLPPAVLEGDSAHVQYWSRVCALYGVDFADVPWTQAADHLPKQKLNFTSGLFTWRRGSRFAERYWESVRQLLDARIAQSSGEFFTADQVVFTPLIVRDQLRWKSLGIADHSIVLGPFLSSGKRDVPDLSAARVLHYSNALSAPFRPLMVQLLAREVPDFHRWLERQEQDLDLGPAPMSSRGLAAVLRAARGLRYQLYARSTEPAK
jgi:hypothetical protein